MSIWDIIGPVVKAVLAMLTGRDRQTGRDEQRAADEAAAAKILEKQRDESSKPIPGPTDVLDSMHDGKF